jgi:hypothetical protein
VHVAIQRGGKRCSWLASKRGTFTRAKPACGRPRWLRAEGATHWRFALRRSLAPGHYVVFSRATIGAGFPEARFSSKDRNRIAFDVG